MQKGYKHTEEARKNMREAALKRDDTNRIKSLQRGKNHSRWSSTPNLLTLHKRIHRAFGKASLNKCTSCNEQARDWALIGKEYSDRREDYQPMCRLCHVRMDKNWLRVDRSKHKIIRDDKGRIVTTVIV